MFKIGKLFHLTQVVDDLERADRWYDDVFSVERFYNGYEELAGRDASLIAIGDVILEPMTPAKVEPLRNQSVKRFHQRFGQHLHPRETPGQLEFAVYGDYTSDPRLKAGWSDDRWRQHPLGIEGASSIGIVVADMAKAKRLYCDVLNGTLLHEELIAGRKRSLFVSVGEDTVVELAQPLSPDSVEGRELAKNGEGIYSLIFRTNNLVRAREFLRSKQHRPEEDGQDTMVLEPDQAFGMRLGFTRRDLPNDPR